MKIRLFALFILVAFSEQSYRRSSMKRFLRTVARCLRRGQKMGIQERSNSVYELPTIRATCGAYLTLMAKQIKESIRKEDSESNDPYRGVGYLR